MAANLRTHRSPERIRRQAARIGANTEVYVEVIMRERRHPEQGYRSCLGILRLAKTFGRDRLEAACERALEINARSYTSLHSILKNGLDRQPRTRVTDEPGITHHNTVLYRRLPRLFDELELAHGDGRFPRLFRSLIKTDLLIFDDWGPERLNASQRRDLMEIIEDRYEAKSTLITSQLPVDTWHEVIGEPTFADAILDRIVHNAYRLKLDGQSLRKTKTKTLDETPVN
ncbi:MAG: ATP-binding protein [Rhizobiales bacterium]|nr:ATP-binding protein [Hyphomicrobiales bacterium]